MVCKITKSIHRYFSDTINKLLGRKVKIWVIFQIVVFLFSDVTKKPAAIPEPTLISGDEINVPYIFSIALIHNAFNSLRIRNKKNVEEIRIEFINQREKHINYKALGLYAI